MKLMARKFSYLEKAVFLKFYSLKEITCIYTESYHPSQNLDLDA